MLLVARKNLFAEKTRLAISIGGIALSVFLIGILLSLFRGWSERVGSFVEDVPADLWVASEGTTDFTAAASILPGALGLQLELAPKIDTVAPLIVRPMIRRSAWAARWRSRRAKAHRARARSSSTSRCTGVTT